MAFCGARASLRPGFVFFVLAVLFFDVGTTQYGPITVEDEIEQYPREVYTMSFNGLSFIQFDFPLLPPQYFQSADTEKYEFYFSTWEPDGLVWLHDYQGRKIYMAMRDGRLVFVEDDGRTSPRQTVVGNRRFDDGRWYFFQIKRQGRDLNMTVSDEHLTKYTFNRNVQFIVPAQVYLGGTSNTAESTGGRVTKNFQGTLADIKFITYTRDANRIFRNRVNLASDLGTSDQGTINQGVIVDIITWPSRLGPDTFGPKPAPPTPPPVMGITLIDPNAYVAIRERFVMRDKSSIEFKFRTITRKGLLLYTGSNIFGTNYFTLEIYDGKLYLIHNFGRKTTRTLISESEVSDGQTHQVELSFTPKSIVMVLDGRTTRIPLAAGERLPENLGEVYLGGFLSYQSLPWHTWARTGYQGCLEDVRINGEIVNFNSYVGLDQLVGRVEKGCMSMPQQCSTGNRCQNGFCMNKWNDYMCDCRDTDYSGRHCQTPAWTGVFDGNRRYKMTLEPEGEYHVNDISFRFKTMATNGLIFQTRAKGNGKFIRAELVDGQIRITTNLGNGRGPETFTVGNNLNDMEWHTVYIQRRGGHMEVWVDKNERDKIILPGEGFKLFLHELFIAGHVPEDNLNIPSNIKPFIGYLRNFYINDFDVFRSMQDRGMGVFYQYPNVPLLIFNDITVPSYDSHIRLPGLISLDKLNMHFLFKTNEPSGVIFFNEGPRRDMFAVELFEGRLHVKLDTPGNQPIDTITPKDKRYDDGEWHSVSITHKNVGGQRQLMLNVDGLRTPYAVSGIQNIALDGDLYIGGLPATFFEKDYVNEFLSSKTGYRGCLASVDFGRGPPNLKELARLQEVTIYDTCQAIVSRCSEPGNQCFHGGICHDHLNNGTTYCDCKKTGWGGSRCNYHPLGYYFRSDGIEDQYSMMVYTYPNVRTTDSARDEIVFGVMTDETDATLLKLLSGIFNDFIEFKLVDGKIRVEYDTDGNGVVKTIRNDNILISDGDYHVIRFIRTKNNASLIIDEGRPLVINHVVPHGNFDRLQKIFIGGVYQSGDIVDGTGFRGIIGGLNINDHMIFYDAQDRINTKIIRDTVEAPRPYKLKIVVRPPEPTWVPEPTKPPVIPFFPDGLPIIPDDIGGAGIGWTVGGVAPGGGPSGVDVVVFPDGSAGSAGAVPGGLPPADGSPVAAAQVAAIPSLPVTGPRAGALMGTLLGLGVLATSLMWAFYRCKPGCCGGAGAGGAGGPMNISAPRAGASNIGVVQAAAASNTNAAAAGAGADMDSPDTALLAGTRSMTAANGGSSSYFGQSTLNTAQSSSSAAHHRQDSYDSATLRAMGTFSNRGTALGTPGTARHQFSSTSGYSESNMMVTTPGSMQSYQFENANPDYDIAQGVHSNYNSNTLSAGAANAGGFSSSTMSSNYNYSVKTIKTVGGQQALLGYNAGSMSNVIVTPGAMGEEVRVDCCLMTNDGHSVVTGSSLGPPQVWNMSNGELLRIMQGETVGSTYLHLVNGDRLLVGAINSDLEVNQYSVPKGVHNYVFQIWDFATGRPLDMAERETLSALAVMNDADKVLFGRSDKFGGGTNIIIWDLLGNQPLKEMRYDAPVGNNDYISYINMSQDDRYVIAGFTNTFDNFAEFVLLDTMSTSYSVTDPNILRLDASPECTAVLPREEAVTGLRNGDLVVWSIRTGQPSRQLLSNNGKHAHSREVKAVARSEDSRFLVSASADGTLKLWDLESERHISTMSGHNDEVWCCAISADNEIIVSGSRDGTIRLWRLRNGQEICAFNAGVDVFYITMSRDKGTIVALGDKFGARKLIMLQVVRSKVKRQVPA